MALGNVVTENFYEGIYFYPNNPGGAGNNTLTLNNFLLPNGVQMFGPVIHMQPNACLPACPPP